MRLALRSSDAVLVWRCTCFADAGFHRGLSAPQSPRLHCRCSAAPLPVRCVPFPLSFAAFHGADVSASRCLSLASSLLPPFSLLPHQGDCATAFIPLPLSLHSHGADFVVFAAGQPLTIAVRSHAGVSAPQPRCSRLARTRASGTSCEFCNHLSLSVFCCARSTCGSCVFVAFRSVTKLRCARRGNSPLHDIAAGPKFLNKVKQKQMTAEEDPRSPALSEALGGKTAGQ